MRYNVRYMTLLLGMGEVSYKLVARLGGSAFELCPTNFCFAPRNLTSFKEWMASDQNDSLTTHLCKMLKTGDTMANTKTCFPWQLMIITNPWVHYSYALIGDVTWCVTSPITPDLLLIPSVHTDIFILNFNRKWSVYHATFITCFLHE